MNTQTLLAKLAALSIVALLPLSACVVDADDSDMLEDEADTEAAVSAANKSWSNVPLPSLPGAKPVLFQRHRTMFWTQDMIEDSRGKAVHDGDKTTYPFKRAEIVDFDGAPAVKHHVGKGQLISDFGWYKEWDKPNNTFRGILRRYQVYYTGYREFSGKQFTIEGGLGYGGNNWRHDDKKEYGTDGWAVYTMISGDKGHFFLYNIDNSTPVNQQGTKAGYGYHLQGDNEPHPLNKWVTIDLLVDMKHGYSLYQDGEKINEGKDTTPFQHSASDCKKIAIGNRLMYGGNPDELVPTKSHDEYFRNDEIYLYE